MSDEENKKWEEFMKTPAPVVPSIEETLEKIKVLQCLLLERGIIALPISDKSDS